MKKEKAEFFPAVSLFAHEYYKGIRVEVTDKGVTIWDTKAGRWIVDASCLTEEEYFSVGPVKKFPTLKGCSREFALSYERKKKTKNKGEK